MDYTNSTRVQAPAISKQSVPTVGLSKTDEGVSVKPLSGPEGSDRSTGRTALFGPKEKRSMGPGMSEL